MSAWLNMLKQMAVFIAICCIYYADAKDITVPAGADLQTYINQSQPGDHLFLSVGTYRGNIIIDRPLTITGSTGGISQILGDGTAHAIWVKAEKVDLSHLTVSGSGQSLQHMNAGIFLDKTANFAHIHHNRIMGNLTGIYVWGPSLAMVEHNIIRNDNSLRVSNRGNGISIWRSPGTVIQYNDISGGRDGIYTNVSTRNLFYKNHFSKLRFAVHYMYTEDSSVIDNDAENVDSAYVLMFSNSIVVVGNVADHVKAHGLMLNSVNYSIIQGNNISNADKGSFLYNANYNTFTYNTFINNAIGMHYTAGSAHNIFHDNAFINNRTQVMYVGTSQVEWSYKHRGNYWSDHSAFDLNGDGIADTPYRPNNLMDQVLWRAPSAKLLMNSPATQLLKYAQQQFPSVLPGGATDHYPLMSPPNHTREKK